MEGALFVVSVVGALIALGLLGGVLKIIGKKKGEGVAYVVSGSLMAAMGVLNLVLAKVYRWNPEADTYAMAYAFIALGVTAIELGRLGLRIFKLEKEIEGLRAEKRERGTNG